MGGTGESGVGGGSGHDFGGGLGQGTAGDAALGMCRDYPACDTLDHLLWKPICTCTNVRVSARPQVIFSG